MGRDEHRLVAATAICPGYQASRHGLTSTDRGSASRPTVERLIPVSWAGGCLRRMRRSLITTATVLAAIAGGAGVAYAVGGGDEPEQSATGSGADTAKAAALE